MKTKVLTVGMAFATSFAMAEDISDRVNPEIWFDGTEECASVDHSCVFEYGQCDDLSMMSCWFDTDDRKDDQGGSYAIYPFDSSGYNGSFIAPEIEKLGYVAIGYHLADPTQTGQEDEYPYNFVKFGFYTNGYGELGPALNISSTGGLCATYTSSMDVELEVNTDKTGKTPCFVRLPKTEEPKTVDKAIEDFKQATWAPVSNKVASCAEAFKEARSIMFKIDGGAAEADGELRIFEVGPKGTCKGGKTIKKDVRYCYNGIEYDDGHRECDYPHNKLRGLNATSFASISVTGRLVTLNGLGRQVQYSLFDMQGNTVHSGIAAGQIDFSSVKSGNYLLKVKGNLELTRKIELK